MESIFLSIVSLSFAVAVGACASFPKPELTPEDRAKSVYKEKGETYLELCVSTCALPGLFGDDVAFAKTKKIEKTEGFSNSDAANDFANRFNRAMLDLARQKIQSAEKPNSM